jgi:hypothetical protein
MKNKILTFILFLFANAAALAQTPPLNKQQTLEYINKLYINSYVSSFDVNIKVKSVTLDNEVLVITFNDGQASRHEITKLTKLEVMQRTETGAYFLTDKHEVIFAALQHEVDANRLKKALEHLIDLLKAEKGPDPFDN